MDILNVLSQLMNLGGSVAQSGSDCAQGGGLSGLTSIITMICQFLGIGC